MNESLTVDEFCTIEKICRSSFYNLRSDGKAPPTYLVGRQRRISREAYIAWRTARESEAA